MVALGAIFTLFSFGLQSVYGGCHYDTGLGMMTRDIRDSQITASSSHSQWTQPFAGRLWNDRRPNDGSFGGWCAKDWDDNPYFQVEFKEDKVITAVATQGLDFPSGNWVTKYAVNYSCDGETWQTYRSRDNNTVLSGNRDGYSVVKNVLHDVIIARVIRIKAVEWNPYGIVCIRMELYGCHLQQDGGYEDCRIAAGMENRQISNQQITASSHMSERHPAQGRLHNVFQRVNGSAVWGSWCTHTVDTSQYIQVDLGVARNISGVATQGSEWGNWVTKYMVNYSMDGLTWKNVRNESGTVQVFRGNWDDDTVIRNMFDRRMPARFIRINPRAWRTPGQICMRAEIYVCQPYQRCPKPTSLPTLPSKATSVTPGTNQTTTRRFTATQETTMTSVIPSMHPHTSTVERDESVVGKLNSQGTGIRNGAFWTGFMAVLCCFIYCEKW